MWAKQKKQRGFTIVELLIVIVVIGILAAISIVAYSGIQKRAVAASLVSDLSSASKQLRLYQIDTSAYPTGLDCGVSPAVGTICLRSSTGTSFTDYSLPSAGNGRLFCITATNNSQSYYVTNDGPASPGSCPIFNGLVGWWRLNASAADASGGATDGIINGATPAVGQNNQPNSAYAFNGTNQSINLNPTTTFPVTTGTITLWAKLVDTGTNPQIMFFYGASSEDGCSGLPAIVLSTCGFTLQNASSAINVAVPFMMDNQWHSLVGTWDAGASNAKVYFDGILTATSNLGFTPNVSQQTTAIGKPGTNSRYSNGVLDDVRIYNRALSASEVQSLFGAGAQ